MVSPFRHPSILTSIEWTMPLLLLFSFFSAAINPGCKCIRFKSTFGKEWGMFSSPDYPESYPSGIRCLLYSFQAPRDHIAQVVLEDFNLPETKSPAGCLSVDYLKFFLHLEEDGVNELTPWNSLLCGHSKNQSFFSASRHLIIQFHSGTLQRKSPWRFGFIGRFKFVDASQFESNGRLVPGTKCDYQFQSANKTMANGRFFSPNYPSTYPHNIKCSYFFHASLHERVKLIFETVNVQPVDSSCLNKTDVVRVLDGSSPTSSVISLICNDLRGLEILSTGPDLLVEFIANSEYPNTGFKGGFHFVKIQFDNPHEGNQQHPELVDSLSLRGHDGLTQASTLTAPRCNQVVTSDGGRNGTFTSPNYPHQYSPKTQCRFDFIGHGRERVQIIFTDFSLFHPLDKHGKSCNGEDTLTAFVQLDGNLARLEDFCGINTPSSLMSNGHRLTLEFNAPKSSRGSTGFSAQYFFVEDFGVRTGRQLRDYPCAFVYNSSGSPNGTFASPNHPGAYPRDTECHYFFYGKDGEHVDIEFQQFNLQGSPPCDETARADYLEFSNYMPTDPTYQRTCGTLDPFRIQSEGKFFRVTFRSNSILDSTGFFAVYSFCDNAGHKIKRARKASGSLEIAANRFRMGELILVLHLLQILTSALITISSSSG